MAAIDPITAVSNAVGSIFQGIGTIANAIGTNSALKKQQAILRNEQAYGREVMGNQAIADRLAFINSSQKSNTYLIMGLLFIAAIVVVMALKK